MNCAERRIAGEQRRRELTRRGTVEIGIERQWNREALNSSEPELQRIAMEEQRIEMHNLTHRCSRAALIRRAQARAWTCFQLQGSEKD